MDGSPSARKAHVILVESHSYLREHIRDLLACEPEYELVADIESGVEAVSEARRLKPDLIVMDLLLSDSNGLMITRIIKKLLPHCHVILLTGWPEYRNTALASGATEIVIKPNVDSDLLPLLKRVYALAPSEGEEITG